MYRKRLQNPNGVSSGSRPRCVYITADDVLQKIIISTYDDTYLQGHVVVQPVVRALVLGGGLKKIAGSARTFARRARKKKSYVGRAAWRAWCACNEWWRA